MCCAVRRQSGRWDLQRAQLGPGCGRGRGERVHGQVLRASVIQAFRGSRRTWFRQEYRQQGGNFSSASLSETPPTQNNLEMRPGRLGRGAPLVNCELTGARTTIAAPNRESVPRPRILQRERRLRHQVPRLSHCILVLEHVKLCSRRTLLDRMIGAQAIVHRATLVAMNADDLSDIPDFVVLAW